MKPKFDMTAAFAQAAGLPAERSIETVTGEILDLKKTAGESILGIGQRLIEAKGMLSHGEWLPWLTEQVEFSERTATRFMRLAREWTNQTALSDLGATKALVLLALPPEEREIFMAEPHEVNGEEKLVIDMSARQLEQAIKERDEARKQAEAAKADAAAAEQARAKMEADMVMVNASLSAAQEGQKAADETVSQLEAQLAELKAAPVDVAVMAVDQETIEQAKAEAVAAMQDKLDKAKDAKKKAEEKRKAAEDALADAQRKMEEMARTEKKEALTSDKDMAAFEVLFTQGQGLGNQMRGLLLKARSREDQTMAQGMEKAMLALADAIRGCVADAE